MGVTIEGRQLAEIGRELGVSLAAVHAAEDTKLQRNVALKVMKPMLAVEASARQRFLREARATAALTHDHIVAIHHIDKAQGVPFLAIPLLQGETLEDRLIGGSYMAIRGDGRMCARSGRVKLTGE